MIKNFYFLLKDKINRISCFYKFWVILRLIIICLCYNDLLYDILYENL